MQTADNQEQIEELLEALRRVDQNCGTEERFEMWYHELWEARHDQPGCIARLLPAQALASALSTVTELWLFPVVEPPQLWAALANSPQVPIALRRECVMQLFRRHVRPGMKLSDLTATLDHPAWLRQNHVCDWKQAAGSFWIPVNITAHDSTFSVLPFREHDVAAAIYLRVSGHITAKEFVKLLREGDEGQQSTILEVSADPR
jgi:hypothetical protein